MKNTINYGAILAPALLFSACGTGQKEVAEKPLNIIHTTMIFTNYLR